MQLIKTIKSLLFLFSLLLLKGSFYACAQTIKPLWHNAPRRLRYHPEGQDFVITNGERRFNRALYGSNTSFRVEAGDQPEFALYLPGMGGNLKFGLIDGSKSKWLIKGTHITARYRPGSMLYTIKDKLLGNGQLQLQVLAGATTEQMLVKATFINTPKTIKLLWAFGGATGKKFSRDGDIGADPESSFYLQPAYCQNNEFEFNQQQFTLKFGQNKTGVTSATPANILYGSFPASSSVHQADANQQDTPYKLLSSAGTNQPVLTGLITPAPGKPVYWVVQYGKPLPAANAALLFTEAETARQQLASRILVKTPDPYINTLGGALSVAADGIWEAPSYMHGAVAWRMRLPAWRGPYVADVLGWHDRASMHFQSYALSQLTEPATGPVVADTALHLARQLETLGTSMFSSGYISRNPGGVKLVPHHYDMNLAYMDELLNHFNWTGNLDEVKKLWPVIKRSLAWEKRNYDTDGDGLYDAYCAIWASDALQYSGGGVAHSSAYNYRANKSAAYLATLVGDDPAPYQAEADKILKAIHQNLWINRSGSYAEYKDLLGLQLVHPSAGLWTIYHCLDSEVPNAMQAYQALRYVDTQIPHIPIVAQGVPAGYYVLSTTNWLPYDWSLNNVAMAESLHTALAYWQGNRKQTGFQIWKSALLESMYLGASPGNFQQLSFYDAARGELYRDFADPIGMAARSLVEGLFGIRPNLLKGQLTIAPGLPDSWNHASLSTPDVAFNFKRTGQSDTYQITPRFNQKVQLTLRVAAQATRVASVKVNGKAVKWYNLPESVGQPLLQIEADKQATYHIKITWAGKKISVNQPVQTYCAGDQATISTGPGILKVEDPQQVFDGKPAVSTTGIRFKTSSNMGQHTYFAQVKQGAFTWWQPFHINIVKPIEMKRIVGNSNSLQFALQSNGVQGTAEVWLNANLAQAFRQKVNFNTQNGQAGVSIPVKNLIAGSNHLLVKRNGNTLLDTTLLNWNVSMPNGIQADTISLSPYFNDQVTHIFTNKYLSPRAKSPTLALPWQGIGNWAYPLTTANIDDTGLKQKAVDGVFTIPQQIPFAIKNTPGKNVLFTSRWDNYPHQATVPLTGSASHIYLLMAGSTNPMQSRMTNATVTISYTDGSQTQLKLNNPENWWPIEQDNQSDGFAFDTGALNPLRVYLKTGEVTDHQQIHTSIKGFSNRAIDGGAATVLDLPLNKSKQLKMLTITTLTNDVVIGLMAATLIR